MCRLWLVPIAFLAAAFAARPVAASSCFLGPYVVPASEPPLDCTIVFYTDNDFAPPRAYVYRNNQQVDVTGTALQVASKELDVAIYTVDCDGRVVAETHSPDSYFVYNLTLANVQVGEDVWVESQLLGKVQPAGGACNNSELPEPSCSGMYDWESCNPPPPPPIDETPDVDNALRGCNAGGGSAGASIGLLGLALLACRRRRQ